MEHLSATTRGAGEPAHATISIHGRTIDLAAAVIVAPHPGERGAQLPRLREDKVALRVLGDLERALDARVPAGTAVLFTLGAPILEPKKLVEALTNRLLRAIEKARAGADERETILGNRVRFCLVGDVPWSAKTTGFVFSGDPDLGTLVTAMRSLHACIAAAIAASPVSSAADERWLVLRIDGPIADAKTYRRILTRVTPADKFARTFIELGGGRLQALDAAAPAS